MLDNAPALDLLQRVLDASALRQRVIAGNIANQNTPGYTRQTVQFEDLLRETLESGGDSASVRPTILADVTSPAGPDGNNVSMELEMNALRENRLLYETYATLLRGHFGLIETSIGR